MEPALAFGVFTRHLDSPEMAPVREALRKLLTGRGAVGLPR